MPETAVPASRIHRAVRRTAGSIGVAAVLAGVVPALANAAGANVANPVALALRASGDKLAGVVSVTAASCAPDPSASPSLADPSASPGVAGPSGSPSAVEPDGTGTSPSPSTCPDPDPDPSPSPSPTGSATVEPDGEDDEHGRIVSTVARCAPRGRDPLLSVEGGPERHGGYVRAAAHGETLTTPWGTFDLSTLSGAERMCAALEAATATVRPSPEAARAPGRGKGRTKARERTKKAGKHHEKTEAGPGSD